MLKVKKNKFYFGIAFSLSIFYSLALNAASHFMYTHLLYKDQDLAIRTQILWGLAHGSSASSILGGHFFIDHVTLFFYLLKNLYALFPSPVLLLCLQSVAIGSGIVLSYCLATRHLKASLALLVAVSYLLYPAVILTNLYEFHQTTLAIPFFFLMILAYHDNQFIRFCVYSALAMSMQENMGLAVLMMGVVAWIEKKKNRWIFTSVTIGISWTYVSIFLLKSTHTPPGTAEWLNIYSHLGASWFEILKNALTQPTLFLEALFSVQTLQYINRLLSPFLFLPILGFGYLIVILPFFFQHALSLRSVERLYSFHYFAEMIPFLIWSTILGIAHLQKKLSKKHIKKLIVCFLISFGISISGTYLFITQNHLLETSEHKDTLKYKLKMIDQIPPDASVMASIPFLAKLSHRKELYLLHNVYRGARSLSTTPYAAPKNIEYMLVDMNDRYTFNLWEPNPEYDKNLDNFFKNNSWELIDYMEDTLLFKQSEARLSGRQGFHHYEEILRQKTPQDDSVGIGLNHEITLKSLTLKADLEKPESIYRLTFHWRLLEKTDKDYNLILVLTDSNNKTIYKTQRKIGYRLLPTSTWNPTHDVLESYRFSLPPNVNTKEILAYGGVFLTKNADPQKTRSNLSQLKKLNLE